MASWVRVHRLWLALLVVAALGSVSARREQPSAEEVATPQPAAVEVTKAVTKYESEADKRIRRELDAVIAQDPALKDRAISFSIDNGDITATGTVRTETERQRINELAMNVDGVKSVANALRVTPGEGGN